MATSIDIPVITALPAIIVNENTNCAAAIATLAAVLRNAKAREAVVAITEAA